MIAASCTTRSGFHRGAALPEVSLGSLGGSVSNGISPRVELDSQIRAVEVGAVGEQEMGWLGGWEATPRWDSRRLWGGLALLSSGEPAMIEE
ncbi:hypothetical protein NHX12_008872 [Muraenolepis orangiensis]|uniref:Uncharacterized protein n=1 Tax=Muraenolepis orangiensis TaxID=630683 RepID=A0A9Q0DM52_9TELE|nr:hypothetical protein NHX12_008872 [Muraenolepis orangiensis]